MKKYLLITLIFFLNRIVFAQLFPNGDFEAGTTLGCDCATNFICGNDAGRVVDGVHPVYVVGNQGCVTGTTNYCNVLGAHSGTGYMYFYAGADNYRTSGTYNFVGGEEVCFSVWYCGPQGSGAPGQNTANAHFSFGVDGAQVGPDVTVPVNTGWTQHTYTMIMTPGAHYFSILSGGAAQYSIWTDDFEVDICSAPCDGSWNVPTPVCSDDADINLTALITGDPGGTWSGTGVTGTNFDPSVGTQSVTYTAPCGDVVTQTINVTTAGNAAWNVPTGLCSGSAPVDLSTFITGNPGGTFTGIGITGNMFDPAVGSQSITYTQGIAPCDDIVTLTINVTSGLSAAWNSAGNICEANGSINLDLLITGDVGGTWSGTGVTGNNFNPAGLNGPINITYAVGTVPCVSTNSQAIIVNPIVDASWTTPVSLCSSGGMFNLNSTITGTAGGTWSGIGVTGNMFNPTVGTQTITYTIGTAPCDETLAQTITVIPAADASWTTVTVCQFGPDVNLNGLIAGTPGGTWSGTGVTGNLFDPSVGTQNITYVVGSGVCIDTLTQAITVSNPTVTVLGNNITCFGNANGSATANVVGGSGTYTYAWSTSPVQTTQTASNLPAGNYTVNITDVNAGCSITGTVTIVEPSELILVMDSTLACAPNLGSASANVSGGNGPYTYSWTNSSSTNSIAGSLDSGTYAVTVTDASGCIISDSVQIIIYDEPVTSITNDTTIVLGESIQLSAYGGLNYLWNNDVTLSCDNCQYPIAMPEDSVLYCVTITDSNSCEVIECVKINVEIVCGEVFVPNAFSPNNDNENDILCIYNNCLESVTFIIYDRWGEKIFTTSNPTICWDGTYKGKNMNTGIYVYTLEGYLINGTKVSKSGNITLVR